MYNLGAKILHFPKSTFKEKIALGVLNRCESIEAPIFSRPVFVYRVQNFSTSLDLSFYVWKQYLLGSCLLQSEFNTVRKHYVVRNF